MPFCVICRKHGRSEMKGKNTLERVRCRRPSDHGERTDWMPRARMILLFGATQSFEPFDRWDKNARLKASRWGSYWMSCPFAVRKLKRTAPPCISAQRISRYVDGTLSRSSYSLRAAGDLGAHDLTHLHQISRVMAHQYREAVGPGAPILACCSAPATALLSANESHTRSHR